ncbi:T9SS type A sorting domain-containing protein [Ferruginibacter albus]|uniref:T9SS type A sorting domain-containing protein n=1 Tax=Ferruginibacter albus TaxID=2875540 RepID=UPI001CC3A853|nr:T9SS type A sorting domain-containing protein [Ferruginibacter albus]UAY51725.1 T9SS type A sorting domain-containing protein [Ferruginibacter albus]
MKKILTFIAVSLFSTMVFAQGTKNIVFTAKANAANGVDVYAKNISGSTISGILGASNLTLCLVLPSSLSPQPTVTISSPIGGQTFDAQLHNTITINATGYDIYTYNGLGSTGTIDFPSNTEVLLATFNLVRTNSTTTNAALAMLAAGGISGFDYCYIAPGGTDQTDYSNPFYGVSISDPNLHNCGGANDPSTNCTSLYGVANAIVPVKFTAFNAVKNADNANLTWSVANESANTDHYEIERSTDGTSFSKIATAAIKGGSSNNNYSYTDANISILQSNGTIYYRIKQVDKSGQVTYTEIRTVKLNGLAISVFPNPVKNVLTVSTSLTKAGNIIFSLTDATGKQLRQLQTSGIKGSNTNTLQMEGLASGSYLLKVSAGTETSILTIFKN